MVLSLLAVRPRSKRCSYVLPSRLTVAISDSTQRVDDRRADAVQPARRDVAGPVELASGVQRRQDQFERRNLLDRVLVDRNASAVVRHAHAAPVLVQHDFDGRRVAVRRLVDRVVDDLPEQVVQAGLAGPADVHAGALADGFEAFEDLDVGSRVGCGFHWYRVVYACLSGWKASEDQSAAIFPQRHPEPVEGSPSSAASAESFRSTSSGLCARISASFLLRLHPFNCFSRRMASAAVG